MLSQRVVSVRYFGLDIGDGLGWERVGDGLDTMDFGLDLALKVTQYVLLNSQDAIRERLAQVSAAYEQAHRIEVAE